MKLISDYNSFMISTQRLTVLEIYVMICFSKLFLLSTFCVYLIFHAAKLTQCVYACVFYI